MNIPKIIGLALLALGSLILIGFGLYEAGLELWSDPEVPLLVKLGLGALTIGFLVLVGTLIVERLKDSKQKQPYDNDHNL